MTGLIGLLVSTIVTIILVNVGVHSLSMDLTTMVYGMGVGLAIALIQGLDS